MVRSRDLDVYRLFTKPRLSLYFRQVPGGRIGAIVDGLEAAVVQLRGPDRNGLVFREIGMIRV